MCELCLSESMSMWAYVKWQAVKSKELKELQKYIESFIEKDDENNKGVSCLSCNERSLEVCPACFARVIQGKMESLNINKEIINEFKKVFWFNGKEKHHISKTNSIRQH
jgi:hypothetical protein